MLKSLDTPMPRKLFFTKQFDQASISELTRSIIEINEHDRYLENLSVLYNMGYVPEPIEIYIDSYGGSVYQGLGVISLVKKSITPIHTIVTGCAMSCGFLLLVAGHKRFAYEHSTAMYHQLSSSAWGKLKDIHDDAAEATRLQSILEQHVLEHTKITRKKLQKNFEQKKDWFISGQDLMKFGIVDEII